MTYELYYWPEIQGRGELVRLALEEALTDEEIEAAMRDDPDWADLIDMDWSDAVLVVPKTRPVVLNLDWEVFEFFERLGPECQTRINAVLRRFMEKAKKSDAAE